MRLIKNKPNSKSKTTRSRQTFSVEDDVREYRRNHSRPSLPSYLVRDREALTDILGSRYTPPDVREEITKAVLELAEATGVTVFHHRLIAIAFTEMVQEYYNSIARTRCVSKMCADCRLMLDKLHNLQNTVNAHADTLDRQRPTGSSRLRLAASNDFPGQAREASTARVRLTLCKEGGR